MAVAYSVTFFCDVPDCGALASTVARTSARLASVVAPAGWTKVQAEGKPDKYVCAAHSVAAYGGKP